MKKKYTIGIDIGGTKMAAVLFDGKRVAANFVLATPKDTLDHFLIMVKALVDPLIEKAAEDKVKISGIGLGVAGVLDKKCEKVLSPPNIPIIKNIKLGHLVEKMLEMPVKMDNDVNCFLRAESEMGVAKKYNNVYGIIIGTGIGGAWLFNNEFYYGANGGAGEPGETIVDISTGLTLEQTYHKLTQGNPEHLASEAYAGDVLAEKLFMELGDYIGVAFANIVNIIDPEVIVVGGGAVESSDLFFSQTKKVMKSHIASTESQKNVKILKGKLGRDAGAIGAALLIKT
jgi:predicted NBD/HSP70 family sugar kinase